jgi:heme/copper-type cytochrome/quinol oxidase subunit 2
MINFLHAAMGFITHATPASTVAEEAKFAADFINLISLVAFILVEGALIYFVIKYRRKKGGDHLDGAADAHFGGHFLFRCRLVSQNAQYAEGR